MEAILAIMGIVTLVLVGAVGGGVVWGIGNAAGWGKKGSKPKAIGTTARRALPRAYLDVDAASQQDVEKIVNAYLEDAVLGGHAQAVTDTFARMQTCRTGIFMLLEQEFDKNSLTWDKFSAPVEVAFDGVVRNSAQIANRLLTFDSAEYQRMDRIDQAGGYDDESNEVARLKVMRETLREMDKYQANNDRLLTELEGLRKELMALTGSVTDTNQIIEEIQQLADDTKYYV